MRIKTTETKSKLALLIIVTMLLGIFSPAMAAGTDRAVGFTDIENHWAKDTIIKWTEEGLIKGYEDGKFKPNNNISRVEFMAVINRALGFNEEATIEFSDVGPDDWFYADVAKAVKAGYIEGYEDGSIKPAQDISRQEAAVALSRALGIAGREQGSQFIDGADIADWSLPYINALTERGYIEGYSDGSFQAQRSISRAEAVTMLDKARVDIEEDIGGEESEPEEDDEKDEAPDSGGGSSSSGNGGSSSSVEVSAISVDKEALVLALDGEDFADTGKITATISPTNASNKKVAWESSDEDVATVDENGNVTAVAVGEATITATSVGNKNKKATCEVTVGEEAAWEATDGVGTHTIDDTAYIFQEYKLLDGEGEKISLHQDNVASITSNGRELTPNTDSTLWINVRLASGERVYVVKTNDDDIYVAKLDWEGPQVLEIEKQGDDLISCGDGVYRYHYKINLAMKKDDTLVYRIKPTGEIDKQTINEDKDDFSIYFRPTDGVFAQLEGDHTYVIKKDGTWYEGAITYQDKSKYGFTLDDEIKVVAVADLISGYTIKATGAKPGNPGDVPEEALEALVAALVGEEPYILNYNYSTDGLNNSRLVKVTLKATGIKDTGYDKVRILPLTVKKDGEDASDKLQAWMYAAVDDQKWFNTVVTGWGTQGTGFKLDPDENSEMDVYIFAREPGDYEITFEAVDTSRGVDDTKDEAVIATGTATVTVVDFVSKLDKDHYNEGDTLSFTISGFNPYEEVTVGMLIHIGEGGFPYVGDIKILDTMEEFEVPRGEGTATTWLWVGEADGNGVLSVEGIVQPNLPSGVLYITLPDHGSSINNAIELQDNYGAGVHVGAPEH